jgi:hypothetical protein
LREESANAITNTLLQKVRAFAGNAPQSDDIAILALKVLGDPPFPRTAAVSETSRSNVRPPTVHGKQNATKLAPSPGEDGTAKGDRDFRQPAINTHATELEEKALS